MWPTRLSPSGHQVTAIWCRTPHDYCYIVRTVKQIGGDTAYGATHRERCFMGSYRIGQTDLGAYETTPQLTAECPDRWVASPEPIRTFLSQTSLNSLQDLDILCAAVSDRGGVHA